MPNNASALVAYGSYTSDGAARTIEISPGVDHFFLRNRTDWGNSGAVTNIQSEFQRGQTQGTAQGWTQLSGSPTNGLTTSAVTTAGFSFIDSYADDPGAQLSFSAITNADPPVVSSAATTGLSNGDIVRIYNSATAKQLNGYDFTIGSLSANTSFELTYMTAPGSVGGAGNYRRIPFDLNWYPRRRLITGVTTGSTTEIALSVTHTYVVGEKVQFKVSSAYAMTQLNNLVGTITAVTAATNTITVDIDSSAFTAFAFPSSAVAALGATPAQVIPWGESATILTAASKNAGFRGVQIGSNVVGANSAVMDWWAFKADVVI